MPEDGGRSMTTRRKGSAAQCLAFKAACATEAAMNSMTGFGRADAAGEGVTWCVELSSVNRKQLEVVVSLPRELNDLELQVRNEVSARCSRGRVNVHVRGDAMHGGGNRLKVDEALALQYAAAFERLGEVLNRPGLRDSLDPLRWPGVIELERTTVEPETAWLLIEEALREAMKSFLAMRAAEGANLRQDIETRLAKLEVLLVSISAKAAEVPQIHRKALMQRLQEAGLPVDLTDERLIKEIALYADRCDISEELTRARSHLDQFAKYLAAKEAMGRSMDFLTQELGREINTMGSKANNAELAHLVVAAKSEIEKVREQIQNVE
ncbi:MAG: hypothetical protein JWO94_3115 [Verrucomicrobiaceae bacterium]|nr:hypothetical protein [Verrucomicrobiaceae bacterium]